MNALQSVSTLSVKTLTTKFAGTRTALMDAVTITALNGSRLIHNGTVKNVRMDNHSLTSVHKTF